MASTMRKSRRKLSFQHTNTCTSNSESPSLCCQLCKSLSCKVSTPCTWRNVQAKELAITFNANPNDNVCRLCQDDISRVLKNPSHKPRWKRDIIISSTNHYCSVSNCIAEVFARLTYNEEHKEAIGNLVTLPNALNPIPLCKYHYHLIYGAIITNSSTHCATCGTPLRNHVVRTCVNAQQVTQCLRDKTGFDGMLEDDAKVCYPCYISHLQMLRDVQYISTDQDLSKTLNEISKSIRSIGSISSEEQLIDKAMLQTALNVGECLLKQEALLSPSVHKQFSLLCAKYSTEADVKLSVPSSKLVSIRWILSRLTNKLEHHMSCVCKVKKVGTLIYRADGDILTALTLALNKSYEPIKTCSEPLEPLANDTTQDEYRSVLDSLNQSIHKQIQHFVASDMVNPYQFDKIDLNQLISDTDPRLWSFICSITRSISERRGTSKVNDPTSSTSYTKKVRRFFCLCMVMFCTDDRCSFPLHNLLTDMIECLGGSTMLIRMLNRLGVCSSSDTLARAIQYRVKERENQGPEKCTNLSVTVISADNIDFLHSYAQVFCGNQMSSWHGTTIQSVQPKPSVQCDRSVSCENLITEVSRNSPVSKTTGESTQSQITVANPTRHTECMQTNTVARVVGKRRSSCLSTNSPNSSPSKLHVPKRRRRARTGTEQSHTESAHSSSRPTLQQPDQTRPNNRSTSSDQTELNLSSFCLNESEKGKLNAIRNDLVTYTLQRLFHSKNCSNTLSTFVGIQDYFSITSPVMAEQSKVSYLKVLDAIADNKDTIMYIFQYVHEHFVLPQNLDYMVIEGDGKLYDVIQSLKCEYGEELKWVIPFPGDWHLLKNYLIAVMKPYFEAGLRQLAQASGYPAASLPNCGQFKRTHHFFIEAWIAILYVMIETFLESESCNYPENNLTAGAIFGQVKLTLEKCDNDDRSEVKSIIEQLKHFLTQSKFYSEFVQFSENMASTNSTWKFWHQFIFQDALAYIGLFLAIRSGDWDLRLLSLKLMTPIFCAYDHHLYKPLLAHHFADVANLPISLLKFFKKGGFVVSISGRDWHSVGIDEAHEMLINKACKSAVVHPTKEYINRIANYIPYRMKCFDNITKQLFPEEHHRYQCKPQCNQSPLISCYTTDRKTEANIQKQADTVRRSGMFSTCDRNPGLINIAGKKATAEQENDLLNFRKIGEDEFERYVSYFVIKQPSIKPPDRKKKLLTFSTRKVNKRLVTQLEKDRKTVQKCLHKKLKWSKTHQVPIDSVTEQYIPLPLALANNDGVPRKGQKSVTTNCIETRYKDAVPQFITNHIPSDCVPKCCILEGMFIINTAPLGTHNTFGQYASFLMNRFVVPHFSKGVDEIHILFDNPGRMKESPKYFERMRRDSNVVSATLHVCDKFQSATKLPSKFRENVINCRECKRSLVVFLAHYFLNHCNKQIPPDKKLYVAGGFEGNLEDTVWYVTHNNVPQPDPNYKCNQEETDTRIWLHVTKTTQNKILVISPDTDVYHIGLPLQQHKDVIVQINPYTSRNLRYLHLSSFMRVLENDPDLSTIGKPILSQVLQTMYASTGCDYISFFSGIGKATFLRCFFQHCCFISSGHGNTPGTLGNVNLNNDEHKLGLMAFTRLVGTAYMKKHASAFSLTPSAHFNSFYKEGQTPLQHHKIWLEQLRQDIFDRVQYEEDMVPSFDSLHRHWLRTCWVLDMWGQATSNNMALKPLVQYGWKKENEILTIDWDSEENLTAVKERVQGLLKGCHCKTGCRTQRCGCKKKGVVCAEGCECINCINVSTNQPQSQNSVCDSELEDSETNSDSDESSTIVNDEEMDELMEFVFGEP